MIYKRYFMCHKKQNFDILAFKYNTTVDSSTGPPLLVATQLNIKFIKSSRGKLFLFLSNNFSFSIESNLGSKHIARENLKILNH